MNGFRFESPGYLTLLWLLPIFVGLAFWHWRSSRRKFAKVLGTKMAPFLLNSVSTTKRKWKLFLQTAAIALCIFALARPQSGQSLQKVKSEGIEVMFLVDVSQSMLAEDVKPSRLELAKKDLMQFLDASNGDRVGIIAFAGSSILLSPMTSDRNALKMFIDSLSPDSVSLQGTEFRKALEDAAEAFKRGGVEAEQQSAVTRAIVIASDGEDQEKGALEKAQELAKSGIRIFTLGFGTERGGPIPLRDEYGRLKGYLKDRSGQVVMSTSKGTVLKELAEAGRGSYYQATFGGNQMKLLREDLQRLERSVFDSAEVVNYDEKYQPILFCAILLVLLELFLGDRKGVARLWRGRFEVGVS